MDLYPWVVTGHVLFVILAFSAHGVNAFAMYRVKREPDRARAAALLDESQFALVIAGILLLLAIVLGIVAAVMGSHFSRSWPWVAIVVLVVSIGIMTPLAATPLGRVRQALGMPSRMDRRGIAPPAPVGDAEYAAVRARLQPELVGALGILAIAILVWLMVAKPF